MWQLFIDIEGLTLYSHHTTLVFQTEADKIDAKSGELDVT